MPKSVGAVDFVEWSTNWRLPKFEIRLSMRPMSISPVAEATGHTGVAICANGAILYDLHQERIVDSTLVDPETLRAVAQADGAVKGGNSGQALGRQ